jgi:23S rRNA pseudouridine2605 synthase
MNQPAERLNKVLAQLGFGSRRAVDALIEAGSVIVNNQPATLGQKVGEADNISVNGETVSRSAPKKVLLAFHKPAGVTTTKKDRFAKVTVMDYLPSRYQHLYPIGRLDRDSRGLLLFTNDGDIAYHLEHPKFAHEKEYEVTINSHAHKTKHAFENDVKTLQIKIINPDAQTKPVTIINASFNETTQQGKIVLTITEGKKRQIRRLFQSLGYLVTDLLRTRILSVHLDNLKAGEYAEIDPTPLS